MPASSKSQQRFMGMVHALQAGKLNLDTLPAGAVEKVEKAAKSISKKDAKDFAKTKHKGLPEVKESFAAFLRATNSPLVEEK